MWDRVKRWFGYGGEDAPAAGVVVTGPPEDKAARGATLTDYVTPVGFGGPRWSDLDTKRFNTNTVFAGTRAIGQRIAMMGVRVGRKSDARPASGRRTVKAARDGPPWEQEGEVRRLRSHPVLDALSDPNPFLESFDLIDLTVRSLVLVGLSYWWVDDEGDHTRVWYLPVGWVQPDPDAPPLTRYVVRPPHGAEQFTLAADELLRFCSPDVADPFEGLGVLRANALAVQTDAEVQVSQLAAFRNGVNPGLAFVVNQQPEAGGLPNSRPTLTSAQRRALQSLLTQAYTGSANNRVFLILDNLIQDVKQITTTPAEMDFKDSSALVEGRILKGLGVNPYILGQNTDVNRASATVADEVFCKSTCEPICTKIGQKMTRFFRAYTGDPDLVCWVPVPQPHDPDSERADMDQAIRAGVVTVNEVRRRIGLDPLPGSAGDELVKAPTPPPVPTGDKPDAGNKSSGSGLIIEPGWASGGKLWEHLSESEKLELFKRYKAGDTALR